MTEDLTGTVLGAVLTADGGLARWAWARQAPDHQAYHDQEWGRPVRGEQTRFERISLEAFQSGPSWLTTLRKPPALRAAFAGFDPDQVGAFGPDDDQVAGCHVPCAGERS